MALTLQQWRKRVSQLEIGTVQQEFILRAERKEDWTDYDTALAERIDKEKPGWIRTNLRLQTQA